MTVSIEAEMAAGNGTDEAAACRSLLKQRTLYYLAQRESGIRPLGTIVLDLIALSDIEECCMSVDRLCEVLDLPMNTVRQHVVDLIKDGWVEPRHSADGMGLYMTAKAADHASSWAELSRDG